MDETQLLFWLVCGAIAAWGVAGSLGAIAKRLDDQVRLHILQLESQRLQKKTRARALGEDGWDVDILSNDAGSAPVEPKKSRVGARKAA